MPKSARACAGDARKARGAHMPAQTWAWHPYLAWHRSPSGAREKTRAPIEGRVFAPIPTIRSFQNPCRFVSPWLATTEFFGGHENSQELFLIGPSDFGKSQIRAVWCIQAVWGQPQLATEGTEVSEASSEDLPRRGVRVVFDLHTDPLWWEPAVKDVLSSSRIACANRGRFAHPTASCRFLLTRSNRNSCRAF